MLALLRFVSLVLVALSLVPAGAHVLELPHKLAMSADDYRVVQTIYRGWALAGIPILGSIVSTLGLALALRRRRAWYGLPVLACLAMVAGQAIFWTFTIPVNTATANWTVMPADWMTLRARWEGSHVAGAALTLAAFLALVAEAVRAARR